MKPILSVLLCALLLFAATACRAPESQTTLPPESQTTLPAGRPTTERQTAAPETPTGETEEKPMLKLTIGTTPVAVAWEENEAVEALRRRAAESPIVVSMTRYGGFEQVGPLGRSFPSDDKQTETEPGDVVLYSSDQLVIFFGNNSWAYTRLGKITDRTPEELAGLLNVARVTVTITWE